MADDGKYTTASGVAARAGANVNAVSVTDTEINKYVLAVEAYINSKTRTDWSTLVGTTWVADHAAVKQLLTEISECICAMYVIQYDMSGMGRSEGETRLDYLRDRVTQGMKALEDMKVIDFIKETA